MKPLLIIALIAFFSISPWEPDFTAAKKIAKEKNELILLNFSGSDWCGPCIRMHKEIFGDANFLKMASTNLVMVNADFPRSKKNKLSVELQKQNEILAETYNPKGSFPFTVLIDTNGKVIKQWEGLPNQSVEAYTAELRKICDANK